MPPEHLTLRLLLAAGLGAAIGIEREYRQKPAGLRTNILIAVGSALFTIVSLELARHGGSPDRITAQIVTGIGFLGGGCILRTGKAVQGMTTAATIWVNAAVGIAAGAGELALAASATALTLIVLAVLPPIEDYFERRTGITNCHTPDYKDRSQGLAIGDEEK
jgi:putative Mg2+ transporter-C (MgtC) family protein